MMFSKITDGIGWATHVMVKFIHENTCVENIDFVNPKYLLT